MIYLDNGATSFPKPRQVMEAVGDAMMNYCANPGRSSHFMAARTAHEIYKARVSLAALFGIEDAGRIVFTKNCTESINMALKGILSKRQLSEMMFPFPPVALQKQFVTFVEQTDKSKLAIQKSLEKLEILKKALMQKYFG